MQEVTTAVDLEKQLVFALRRLSVCARRMIATTNPSDASTPTDLLYELADILLIAQDAPTVVVVSLPVRETGAKPRVVQALVHGFGTILCETIAPAPVTSGQANLLDHAIGERLDHLGWHPPDRQHGRLAWWREFDPTWTQRHLPAAELFVHTLIDVHGWSGNHPVNIQLGDVRGVAPRDGRPVCSIPGCCPPAG